jgi:DNA-binding MarR family transcriptional regulator
MLALMAMQDDVQDQNWTLLSTHGLVLFHIAAYGDSTMREIADALMITQRRVAQIIHDLTEDGVLETGRQGRRNTYRVNLDQVIADPPLDDLRLADVLRALDQRVASEPS